MKSQIIQYFLVVIGCISLTQCQKDNDYYDTFVGGYIIATHDLKPVPNSLTELVQVEDTRLPTSAFNYVVLDSMVVGTTGRFKFNFTAKKGALYGIRAKHPRYVYDAPTVSFFTPGASNRDSVTFGMFPYSYLRVHIKDTSRVDNYQGVYFFALDKTDDVTILKNPIDTIVILKHVYSPLWFSWQLKYSNNRMGAQNKENIQCQPLDTCDVYVKF